MTPGARGTARQPATTERLLHVFFGQDEESSVGGIQIAVFYIAVFAKTLGNGFPIGAGLTYGLTAPQGVSVSGAVVFGQPVTQ